MIFSNWSKSIRSKSTKFDVKRSSYQNPEIDNYQPCFIVFDILYLNSQVCLPYVYHINGNNANTSD